MPKGKKRRQRARLLHRVEKSPRNRAFTICIKNPTIMQTKLQAGALDRARSPVVTGSKGPGPGIFPLTFGGRYNRLRVVRGEIKVCFSIRIEKSPGARRSRAAGDGDVPTKGVTLL
jgi:hypothetical protein